MSDYNDRVAGRYVLHRHVDRGRYAVNEGDEKDLQKHLNHTEVRISFYEDNGTIWRVLLDSGVS